MERATGEPARMLDRKAVTTAGFPVFPSVDRSGRVRPVCPSHLCPRFRARLSKIAHSELAVRSFHARPSYLPQVACPLCPREWTHRRVKSAKCQFRTDAGIKLLKLSDSFAGLRKFELSSLLSNGKRKASFCAIFTPPLAGARDISPYGFRRPKGGAPSQCFPTRSSPPPP
jgi:hypothetical protein